MNYKVAFLDKTWRTVEADVYSSDNDMLVFIKDEQPVLTCVLRNVSFFNRRRQKPRNLRARSLATGFFRKSNGNAKFLVAGGSCCYVYSMSLRSIGFVGVVCLMALGCATKPTVSDAQWLHNWNGSSKGFVQPVASVILATRGRLPKAARVDSISETKAVAGILACNWGGVWKD